MIKSSDRYGLIVSGAFKNSELTLHIRLFQAIAFSTVFAFEQ
jgi:hypothetical protein